MSKIVKKVKERKILSEREINFMGGVNFKVNPIETLKLITASSIFGEPAYYRDGMSGRASIKDGLVSVHDLMKAYSLFNIDGSITTSQLMEDVIDKALDYDFEATIRWAQTLRHDFYMRLNPQVIMVRAAIHPKRVEFNQQNPGLFREINSRVMNLPEEASSQLAYYIYKTGDKASLPNILKRSWAKKLEATSRYQIYKYKNAGLGLIDVARVAHARGSENSALQELMRTGNVTMEAEETTWEHLKAEGHSWREIIRTINIPHMALLRNLRGIFTEVRDAGICEELMEQLKSGVLRGKQFPFRYYSAHQAIKDSRANHCPMIMTALEECMDIALDNMPKLKGKTMCLSDNSGSAWGAMTSEYGTVSVAIIDNLSSVLTAACSDEGYVGKFGDKLKTYPITRRAGILQQTESISSGKTGDVGGATEHGIWIFFEKAITNKEHWDNIFIYSDQQAGHGRLYGTHAKYNEFSISSYQKEYFNVLKMIEKYRRAVNPKVNIFSIQTAGYTNVVVPEYAYRTNLMYGWTGKEALFADKIIKFWDEKESQSS